MKRQIDHIICQVQFPLKTKKNIENTLNENSEWQMKSNPEKTPGNNI